MAVRAGGPPPAPSRPSVSTGAQTADRYAEQVAKAKATQAENGGPGQAPGPSYNSDTRPVTVGKGVNLSTIGRSPDVLSDRGYDSNNYSGNVMSVYDATNLLSFWRSQRAQGDSTYDTLVTLMRATGFLGPRANSLASIEGAWRSVLEDGASMIEYDPSKPSSADVFDYLYGLLDAGAGPEDDSSSDGPGGGAPKITATIDLTDPGTARVLADTALSQYLGRRASEKEQKEFYKALMAEQMQNPDTTDVVGSTAIRGGGFNPQEFADQWAQGKEGAAEYQAATTFLDTFLKSLENPMEVVQ